VTTRSNRIAIVGGGISGLTAAYEVQRHQSSSQFVLFEATNRLGGIVETVRREGFVIECGPDAWVTEKPSARELAIELGLGGQVIPSNDDRRRTLLLQAGKLLPMPDGMRMMVPTDLDAITSTPLFTDKAIAAYQAEPARAEQFKATAPAEDESVDTFVRRHFGDEVAAKIAGPLLSGVFGGNIERLSVRSVMPAFVKMEREYGSLILALQSQTRSTSKEPIFTTLASGLDTLADAMAATLPAAYLRLNQPVHSIERRGTKWLVSTAPDDVSEEFDAVVLATPAHITRQLLAPLNPRLGELLNIEASSAIVVAFAFTPQAAATLTVPQGFGFLVPQTERDAAGDPSGPSILACTFVDQKFPHRVPEGAKLIRAFYGGEAAPSLLTETDESLTAQAHRQLTTILGHMPEPAFAVVRRWPRSLPQYEVGHQSRVAEIERFAAQLPNLHLTGNTYHGVGLPDLIRDARATARQILDAHN
jgi:oxygen-dependent protoporphyrinogen oxidase